MKENNTVIECVGDLIERLTDELDKNYDSLSAGQRSALVKDICMLSNMYNRAKDVRASERNNENQAKANMLKQQAMARSEDLRTDAEKKKALSELVKVAVMFGGQVLTMRLWAKGYDQMIEFEKTGRFTSNLSRELHLPRLFK